MILFTPTATSLVIILTTAMVTMDTDMVIIMVMDTILITLIMAIIIATVEMYPTVKVDEEVSTQIPVDRQL